MTWTLHHLLYPLLAVVILAGAAFAFHEYQLRKDQEQRVAVEEARQQESAQRVRDIEAARQEGIAALEAERRRPATVETVTKYVKIPGGFEVVDAGAGQPAHIEISGDPQKNLDALTQFGIDCAEASVNLGACQKTAAEHTTQIQSLVAERDTLKKMVVPPWTLSAIVSKSREGSYKPGAIVSYRFGKYWGVGVGAVNDALVAEVNIHFGGTTAKVPPPVPVPVQTGASK